MENDSSRRRGLSTPTAVASANDDRTSQQGGAAAGIDLEALQELASQTPTPLRLADMYRYGTGTDKEQRLRNAQFLHRELPIRVAQRAVDLLTLPFGLSEAAPIQQVAKIYVGYLHKFHAIPLPQSQEDEENFTDFLQTLVLDRTAIPVGIFQGVVAWREVVQEDLDAERIQEMEDALYRFFTARVGLRFLTEHHVLSSCSTRKAVMDLRSKTFLIEPDESDCYVGCISTNTDLLKEVSRVADLVRKETEDYYGVCPDIDIVDCLQHGHSFTYVPHHLHYMVGELLKNSCRATVKRYLTGKVLQGQGSTTLSPIRVVLVSGKEDVTIKVADKGGGIPRSNMSNIWKFLYSTADEKENTKDFGNVPVAGARIRGFGLPLARIYARYFGGELTLKSMEGYGLDAYLHLPRLGDAGENLPRRVRKSPGERDSTPRHGSSRRFSSSPSSLEDARRQQAEEWSRLS